MIYNWPHRKPSNESRPDPREVRVRSEIPHACYQGPTPSPRREIKTTFPDYIPGRGFRRSGGF